MMIRSRVSLKTLGKKNKHQLGKQQRRLQSNQIRKQKREEILNKKRSRGGTGCPLLTVVIPLNDTVDTTAALEILKTSDDSLTVTTNDLGITHISVPRFRQRLSFVVPQYGNLYDLLDAAKVADSLLFLVDENNVDDYGGYCLSCLFAQGLPAPVLTFQGKNGLSQKKMAETKKMILKQFSHRFPGEKLHTLESKQDGMLMLRLLGQQKLKDIKMRENRPHLIAEDVSFELLCPENETGTLKVSGYVRSQTLSVNGLVHLPGWGNFQMSQIDAPADPYPFVAEREAKSRKNSLNDVEMEAAEVGAVGVRVLEKVDPVKQESLQTEVIPDPMEGEQTWPTEEELAEADENQKKKGVKRVPKGTSEYQAAWIVDSGDESDDDDTGEDEEDDVMEEDEDSDAKDDAEHSENDDVEEYESLTLTENEVARYDATIDMKEEEQMLAKYKEEKLHVMFPDEVDTPKDSTAKTRFQKYRGLKSFRTSEWDPKENLPLDYARIFQFENFGRTKKRVLKELEDQEGALPGWYVTVHIKDVPKRFMETYTTGKPVVLFGLLQHEQKLSLCHLQLHRLPGSRQPIKSKETMVFHIGYRRFSAAPIYSQHTNGSKHKFERFLPKEGVAVATVYAPVMFPPVSVMMFKESPNGKHELIATGSLLSVNPDRIIAKRVVLSGHPFKINRKMAVVRYMFFNREDIAWFKPIELRTKWGRRGHIKVALGTHGHMKCTFDGQLKSQDTVLMNLYKRMFPKWRYNSVVTNPAVCTEVPTDNYLEDADNMDDEMFD